MTNNRWGILQLENWTPYLSSPVPSSLIHTSFSLSCKSAAQEVMCHSPLVPQHQGCGQVLVLLKLTSFLSNISVPSTLPFLPPCFFKYLAFVQLPYFAIQGKGKWNCFDVIIHTPKNHSVETPRCSNWNSCFLHLPPKPNCQHRCLCFWSNFTVLHSFLPVFICCSRFFYFLFLGLLNT